MRLFTRWLRASGPYDWVTSLFLSFFCLCQKGLVGQTEWSQYFPECGGTSQSPVDVVSTLTKYDPRLSPVTPLGYSQLGHRPFTLSNNGHTGKYIEQCIIQETSQSLYCHANQAQNPLHGRHQLLLSDFCDSSHALSSLGQRWLSCRTGWDWTGCRGSSQLCRCTSIGAVVGPVMAAVSTPSTDSVQMLRYVKHSSRRLT